MVSLAADVAALIASFGLVSMLDNTPSTAFLPPLVIGASLILNEFRMRKSRSFGNSSRSTCQMLSQSNKSKCFQAYLTFKKCRPLGEEGDEHPTKTKDRQTKTATENDNAVVETS
jgi:hypothetical protein